MVIKYRRPTSASRVGQDMRNTWSHVVGNLATLVLLALAGCLGYLFWPYLPTLAWAQLVAFSLRGLRDRFKSVKYGIFYKRGAELSDSQAATRLMIYVTLSIALGFDRIGTAGLVLGPLVLAVAAIGFDAATAADEDSDEEDEEDVPPPLPARAMFDAASDITNSDKSLRRTSCDASQPNCRICPPDLPPRTMTTRSENGEKAPPPLPPRGAVAKSPSRASPYAGLGK